MERTGCILNKHLESCGIPQLLERITRRLLLSFMYILHNIHTNHTNSPVYCASKWHGFVFPSDVTLIPNLFPSINFMVHTCDWNSFLVSKKSFQRLSATVSQFGNNIIICLTNIHKASSFWGWFQTSNAENRSIPISCRSPGLFSKNFWCHVSVGASYAWSKDHPDFFCHQLGYTRTPQGNSFWNVLTCVTF